MEHDTVKKDVIKDNISRYISAEKCFGCSACSQICHLGAISMAEDKYGFSVPIVDSSICVECKMCLSVCPRKHFEEKRKRPIECYAATNASSEKSYYCSSGGIFSALAEHVINEGGMVCGAAFVEGFKVQHIIVDDLVGLEMIRKSKYVQSNTNDIYKKVKTCLSENKYVLFSGTPCQVKGLYTFLKNSNCDKLLTVDVVCHGVPSQRLFDDYISDLQKRRGELNAYSFRAKRRAKNGMKWFSSYSINGRQYYRNWPEDSYNYYYMMGKTYRDSCYTCPFASLNRVSDITLCDYWSWNIYHDNDFDKMECVSGVLVNTQRGQQIFEKIGESVISVPTNLEDIVRHNGCLASPTDKPSDREKLLCDWQEKGYSYIDSSFKRAHRLQRIKYLILRRIPDRLVEILVRLK